MEAGKRRPASDTARAASKDEGTPPSRMAINIRNNMPDVHSGLVGKEDVFDRGLSSWFSPAVPTRRSKAAVWQAIRAYLRQLHRVQNGCEILIRDFNQSTPYANAANTSSMSSTASRRPISSIMASAFASSR